MALLGRLEGLFRSRWQGGNTTKKKKLFVPFFKAVDGTFKKQSGAKETKNRCAFDKLL